MNHNKELNKAWEKTGKADFIQKMDNFSLDNISSLLSQNKIIWGKAFSKNLKKVIICADERVLPEKDEFKIGIAGQLVLANAKDKNNFIKRWKDKVEAVRSHDGCGAAAVAWNSLSGKEKNSFLKNKKNNSVILSEAQRSRRIYQETHSTTAAAASAQGDNRGKDAISDADLYGAIQSYNLAKALGAKFKHTEYKKMRGNKDFHDARMIFWSADPEFDPSLLIDKLLPPHFLANGLAFGLSNIYCLGELKILTGIALGNHGFGKLFNKKNPFYVINVGKNITEAKKLTSTAKSTLINFGDKVNFRYFNSEVIR